MVVGALVALLAAGCGSASSTSTKGASANSTRTSTSTTATKQTTTSPNPDVIPAGSVAIVVGKPITQSAFNHWMYVAAKSQATTGQPVIVPDPPEYKGCVAQVHQKIPTLKKAATKTLVADCKQLYTALTSQVMDFLIKADWIEADGAQHGIVPTDAQVNRSLSTSKKKQFPTESSFQSFLSKTGQSLGDLQFRFRINLIFTQLSSRGKGTATARQAAVTKREKQSFVGKTRCTALVRMLDCANYRAG
jgi:hypothetical protein